MRNYEDFNQSNLWQLPCLLLNERSASTPISPVSCSTEWLQPQHLSVTHWVPQLKWSESLWSEQGRDSVLLEAPISLRSKTTSVRGVFHSKTPAYFGLECGVIWSFHSNLEWKLQNSGLFWIGVRIGTPKVLECQIPCIFRCLYCSCK